MGVGESRPGGAGSSFRERSGLAALLLLFALLSWAVHESRTSFVQSWFFSRIASTFGYVVEEGPSGRIRFPRGGPHDERLGYTHIPELSERLDSLDFRLTNQARMTPSLLRWIDRGVHPVYPEKGPAGLRAHDRAGVPLIDERHPRFAYLDFDSVPEIVWRTLLQIESQGLLDAGGPTRNPAIEWDRFTLSAFNLALRELGAGKSVPGGSTLATQIEKYRHSPGGITSSPSEKLRQMLSASLRAYSDGPETFAQRRRTVTEYLNSVPLAGQAGFGEVVGIGEGLWAWYGTPFARANAVLRSQPAGALERLEHARVYRQVLSLLVAQRRPAHYLTRPEGHRRLSAMTDAYLGLLARDGIIPRWLAEAARNLGPDALRSVAPRPEPRGPEPKGAGSVRAELLEITRARGRYELDRLDLTAGATLDVRWDAAANALLADLSDPDFLRREGFQENALLRRGDPAGVIYSVLLLERTDVGNAVRVEADNFPGDMSLADRSRLELGSTAKLRTLATYLEVIEEIYRRVRSVGADSLLTLAGRSHDPLTRWAAEELIRRAATRLPDMLDAALDREYSASPTERFFTGGTELAFSNFDGRFDGDRLSVREAFMQSVNLPFVRLMRDIVAYEIDRLGTSELLSTEQDVRREEYLVKFAEHEGAQYVRRFHRRYRDIAGSRVFETLLAGRALSSTQVGWTVRAVAPDAPAGLFEELVRAHGPDPAISDEGLTALYARTNPAGVSLSDLGFLSRVHPLELWVAADRLRHPEATLPDMLARSRTALVDVYGWLLRTSRQNAQDVRIRTVLELEAFQQIRARWRRLGYPFDDLTPSLGTAIGSAGDQPMALAELAGLILNDGIRLPTVRIDALAIGEQTPFETRFRRRPASGERVLGSEVARALRATMDDVVTEGTGRRAAGSLTDANGGSLTIGGKTGTGDNRRLVHDSRGRLVASQVTGRTASFVFVAGDRYFGVITAYVGGTSAAGYRFTSALPTQILRVLGRRLGPLEGSPSASREDAPERPEGEPPTGIPRLRMASGVGEPNPNSAIASADMPAIADRASRCVCCRLPSSGEVGPCAYGPAPRDPGSDWPRPARRPPRRRRSHSRTR